MSEARGPQSDRPNPRCTVCLKPIEHGQPRYSEGLRSTHIACAESRPTILIADDTADTRELYAMHFRTCGFTVLTASDGAEAVTIALEHSPEVIVMDLAMPQLDGLTATRKIKQDPRARRSRVILLTGYPMNSVARDAAAAGADRYLTKPCLPEDLERHVNELRTAEGGLVAGGC